MQSVRNSSRMLQESFATGTAILAKYAEQRERLKVFTIKLLIDLLNTCVWMFTHTLAQINFTQKIGRRRNFTFL